MRKIKQVAIIIGISAMVIVGCKGKEPVAVTGEPTEVEMGEEVKESEQEQEPNSVSESGGTINEEWTKLWPGESMEVNLEAKHGFIDSFNKNGNDMYKAMGYNGELVTENAYCYFFSLYFDKKEELFADLSFPDDLEMVSEELWEKEMSFWKSNLGQQSGPFLNSNTLEIEVNSKEIVELNGKKLLREEVLGKSTFMDVPKSSRFIAYYYLNEGGQGVCVFGDRSDEQTYATYENVKEVAETIMSTFRE